MLPADQTSWWEEAARLGDAGYLVLTFDFRGYCPGGDAGCSEGTKDPSAAWQDVQGAVEDLRNRGATRVALLGASMGGTASLVVAGQPDADIEAVGTLSAPASIEGMAVTPELLQATTAAKLFVAGNGDTGPAADAQTFYDLSSQPKRLEIVPSNDHGTDLLDGQSVRERPEPAPDLAGAVPARGARSDLGRRTRARESTARCWGAARDSRVPEGWALHPRRSRSAPPPPPR